MGYVEIIVRETHKGLTICTRCDGQWSTGAKFVRVIDVSRGTAPPEYETIGKVTEAICPSCGSDKLLIG